MSRKPLSLAALIEKALADDESARHELYERFNPRFLRFADDFLWRHGCRVPEQDRFDVVSSAWGNIFNSLGSLWSPSNFGSWGLEIVRNEANKHLRQCIKQQQHEVSFESLTKKSSDESGEKEVLFDPSSPINLEVLIFHALFADEILLEATETSPKLYKIVYLRLVEDLDFPTIAENIGESHGNTRTIYNRWIKKLKRRMAGKMHRQKKRLKKTDID